MPVNTLTPEIRSRASRLSPGASLAIVAAVVALLSAACGPAAGIAVTLSSSSAELLRGGEVQVEVTLSRAGGATADVALSATGLPANVDASFSPATLSGDTLSSTLTIAAEAGAAEDSYTVSITGASGSLTSTADLSLDVTSLTVTGRVATILDLPIAGAAVGAQGDTDITDADGSFTLTGLSLPYDLSVWNTGQGWVQIYEGLTSDALLLLPLLGMPPSGTPRSTTITGNLSGGVVPVAADQTVSVCVEGLDGAALGCDHVAATESGFEIPVQWFGDATIAVRVHGLQVQFDGPDGYPIAYPGYGTLAMNLTDGVAALGDVDLGAALTTTAVDLEIDSPDPLIATIAGVQVNPNFALPVMLVNNTDTSSSVLMPEMAGASYTFGAAADGSRIGWQAGVTGTTASVTVPGPQALVSPADAATGITTATNFSATNPTEGPMTFLWSTVASDLQVGLTTMDTTVTIPDLTPYGLALPPSAEFSWQVVNQSGTATEDGTYGIGHFYRFLLLAGQSSPGPLGEGQFALSADSSFTTAP